MISIDATKERDAPKLSGRFLAGVLTLLGIAALVVTADRGFAQGGAAEPGRPAHLHAGSCDEETLGVAVATLTDLASAEGEVAGQPSAALVVTSFNTVPLSLDALLAEDHAIDIHRSAEDIADPIACGEIGGVPEADGSVILGLKEQNQSGFAGIAYLSGSEDGTSTFISIFVSAGQSAGGAGATPRAGGHAATEAEVVDISLTEWDIDLEPFVPAGLVAFDAANDGTMRHSLAIEGEGVDAQLPQNLQPGEAGQFAVALTAGTYTLYCPIGDHRQRGMEIEITVVE
ncbi:MAG: hypothetical protein M3354_01890 [Chloroflexota bacterium]|nr:hypothetical protein [Chloroflexota bacterium]